MVRLKRAHGALLLAALLAAALPLFAWEPQAPEKSEKLRQIEKQMVEVAERGYDVSHALFVSGDISLDSVVEWSRRLVRLQLRTLQDHDARLAAIDAHLAQARRLRDSAVERHRGGVASVEMAHAAELCYLEAERMREIERARGG